MNKTITVKDIISLYDPCLDHKMIIHGLADVGIGCVVWGWQELVKQCFDFEVDSIGVRDGVLAIWLKDKHQEDFKKLL